mgnify:FL=1
MCKANKPILANRINCNMSCHILDKNNTDVNKVDYNYNLYGKRKHIAKGLWEETCGMR